LTTEAYYINRALQIGKNGLGTTASNPIVGAVVVYKNTIIGEGFTSPFGEAHAEVNAIDSVKDKELLKQSTLYVTLEPCNHYGKTPPCSNYILQHQIPKVVIGCMDDNPKVAGNGIKKLRTSGCEVILGVLEKECKAHHKRFFTFCNEKRPYIILKWAETQNGYIAPKTKSTKAPVWITNTYSRQLVHKWRTEEQAILVGANTVIEDNPKLTVRNWSGKNPIRIVIDKTGQLDRSHAIFNDDAKTIVINNDTIDFDKSIASQICDVLYHHNISSVIIEGGAKTLQLFIDGDLWDEARIFTGNTTFKSGIKAPMIRGKLLSETSIHDDVLKVYSNNYTTLQ